MVAKLKMMQFSWEKGRRQAKKEIQRLKLEAKWRKEDDILQKKRAEQEELKEIEKQKRIERIKQRLEQKEIEKKQRLKYSSNK